MTDAWLTANRANWDARVPVHLKAYDLAPLRAGRGVLHPIEAAELGPVAGKRLLHLQCHIGSDTLVLALQGADVTGVDFSPLAIDAARTLATETGLAARFVESDVYAAPEVLGEAGAYDIVFTTWGTIGWLPDIAGWARVVAHFLKPGGTFYFADGHPAALVFDDDAPGTDGKPGWFLPYFHQGALIQDDPRDYADPNARLAAARTYQYMHRTADIIGALMAAGLTLEFVHEHDRVAWRMFNCLVDAGERMWRWPDKAWLPLALSIKARK